MFDRWFDERFAAAGAESYRLSPVRLALAALIWVLLSIMAGPTAAGLWLVASLATEIVFRLVTRPLLASSQMSRASAWMLFAVFTTALTVWSAPGVIFWVTGTPAAQVASAAYFGGHLLYIQAHHSRSPGSIIPAAPALAAPPLVPLFFPQHEGLEQAVVFITMSAILGHALTSTFASLKASERMAAAADELRIQRNVAEAARAEMSVAKDEAEASSQAKTAFLAIMSHEIRTPLNGVLGMTQALLQESRLTRTQRDRLDIIQECGESLMAILNDILDLSKVESGKLELERVEFDLEEVVKGAHQAFTALARNKNLTFTLSIEPTACGVYVGDPTRFRQVIYNLCSNAIKFTEEGEVAVELRRAGSDLVLSVRDTGIGVEADQISRLFGKFEQADSSTTRRYGGAGLGLSIVRQLTELMGGAVRAESEPGLGTTFTIALPLERTNRSSRPFRSTPEHEPALSLGSCRVLLAEDNRVNQLVATTFLAQIGITPAIAENGREAVGLWDRQPFDVILMDVQMPVMDGPAATMAIRAAEALTGRTRTPIIALTANAMPYQITTYEQSGMDGHVSKPIEPAKLFAAIEGALSQVHAEPSSVAAG